MKFRKKISFCTIVLKILLGSMVRSFPQTFSSNIKGKKLPLALSADVSPLALQSFQHEINGDIRNVFQDPVYDTFNFPKIECPLITKPKSESLNCNDKTCFLCQSRSNYLPKFDSLKGLKITSNVNELPLPPVFSSAPNYRDIANFPEVEYPMSASEMWKPNYWNSQPTEYSYNNVNTDYCRNPTLNELFTEPNPMQNFATNLKPGTQINKKFISLKNKMSNDKILMNDKRKENMTNFLDSSKIGITVSSISLAPCPTENKLTSNISYEICPKDNKILDKTNKFFENDVESHLPSQSEILVNECAEIFKDEIKSVLKTMAENIILNDLKKEKVMASGQLTAQTSDILDPRTNCDSLNIYDEFTSPDLLKNRRSHHDLNKFKKYDNDFVIPFVDLESKLTSTDLLIDSYADKFHEEMTSILKSHADDFLLNTFETSKNSAFETNINRSGLKDFTIEEPLKTQHNKHLRKDFSKPNYEPMLPVKNVDIHSHADKLHNDMNLAVKSKADNILLNKFESSNNHNKPSFGAQTIANKDNNVPVKPKSSPSRASVNFDAGEVNRATQKTVNDNNKMNVIKTYTSQENKISSTTQAPKLPDVYIITNDFKSDAEQEVCKESDSKLNNKTSTTYNNLLSTIVSENDLTCENEESVSCKSDENTINNMSTEDGTFLPAPGREVNDIPKDDSTNKEIELEEEFTTDSYPENDGSELISYALSTVAPRTSTVDLLWRDASAIEPDKVMYADELEEYFIKN